MQYESVPKWENYDEKCISFFINRQASREEAQAVLAEARPQAPPGRSLVPG